MDKASTSKGQKPPQTIPRPPGLLRSKSVSTSNVQTPINRSNSIKRSTSKTKIPPRTTQASSNEKEGIAKFMQRSSSAGLQRQTRSCPSSPRNPPSPWARSPARSSPSLNRLESRRKDGAEVKISGGGGQNRGFMKYFKGKKVSQEQEDEHQFRIMHGRLVQWRYVNARAEASMNSVKKVAERKFFRVWVAIARMRNSISESRLQEQKIKHAIKLHQVIYEYSDFFEEWTKLEKRNSEAFNRLARKLMAFSVRVPLLQGAEADEKSLMEAMREAVEVIDGVDNITTKFLPEVENVYCLLSKIKIVLKQEEDCLRELEKYLPFERQLTDYKGEGDHEWL